MKPAKQQKTAALLSLSFQLCFATSIEMRVNHFHGSVSELSRRHPFCAFFFPSFLLICHIYTQIAFFLLSVSSLHSFQSVQHVVLQATTHASSI